MRRIWPSQTTTQDVPFEVIHARVPTVTETVMVTISFVRIESSGILYPWTGLGKMVRTGMYQYVPVQDGTGQYKNSQFVHTCMYQYIPVRTFKKSSGFLTNPERVRRDEIRVIHRLCMGYNVTRSNFKTAQV